MTLTFLAEYFVLFKPYPHCFNVIVHKYKLEYFLLLTSTFNTRRPAIKFIYLFFIFILNNFALSFVRKSKFTFKKTKKKLFECRRAFQCCSDTKRSIGKSKFSEILFIFDFNFLTFKMLKYLTILINQQTMVIAFSEI
ncbi:hypothetical protein COE53_10900 [Bacillus sp. AFS029533]|nr:hypothetical protein COE53_10900 [Bacillus sp. AFS029533]